MLRQESLVLLLSLTLLSGCRDDPAANGTVALDIPTLTRDRDALRPGSGPAIVLVFKATQCLSCSVNIGSWITLRREHPGRVVLLLTGLPDSASATVLRRSRVPVDGVVESPEGLSGLPPYAIIRDGDTDTARVVSIERWTPVGLAEVLTVEPSPNGTVDAH